MKWVDALKAYAKQKGKYVVPRKGTPEYDEVKKLMGKEHKDVAKGDVEMGQAARDVKALEKAEAKPKKPRAPRKKKSADQMAADAKAVPTAEAVSQSKEAPARRRARAKTMDGKAAMVVKEVTGGVTQKATELARNPEAIFQSAVNVHEPIAPPAALAGNLKELKADVAKVRKPRNLPVLVEKENVVSGVPFSFVDFKRKIGA